MAPRVAAAVEGSLTVPRSRASQEGVGYHQTTTRKGRRCSTAVGYLRPAMQRPNLQVLTGALAETICDGDTYTF